MIRDPLRKIWVTALCKFQNQPAQKFPVMR